MKLSQLLDVIRCYELIEVYSKNDVCGEVLIFTGMMMDFYITPIGRERYHKYFTKHVDEVESFYDNDYEGSVITITINN